VLGNVVQKAYDQIRGSNDHLLFGSRNPAIVLSTLHPEVVNIFRLWQIYSDNVNSLLKVTHIPTLQGRIIDAASNLATLDPTLEALMFSIYCVAVQSLVDEDCQSMFSFAKDDLLTRYRFGCHQALLDCGYLRSSDLDCLTALYLYIVGLSCKTLRSLSDTLRSRSGLVRIPGLSARCLQLLYVLRNASASTANPLMPNAVLSRQKCAVGCGGRLSFTTLAFARWLTTDPAR